MKLASLLVLVPAWTAIGTSHAGPIAAQDCEASWSPAFGPLPGANSPVRDMTVFDDGSGPALYVAGYFTSAGGAAAVGIARWDGTYWSALGTGLTGGSLSTGKGGHSLGVFDDGSGPALYVGGDFNSAGGVAVSRFARWDGSSWAPVGSGLNGYAYAMTVHDDGSGPALYAGGTFSQAGGVAASNLARWNGSSWAPVGGGTNGDVYAFTVYDDGSGPQLVVAGSFTTAGGVAANRVARWDGSTWAPFGSGTSGAVYDVFAFDDGSGAGQVLYAGGLFSFAGGVPADRIARWDGAAWSVPFFGTSGQVSAFGAFDDGSGDGPALYAAGNFGTIGGVLAHSIGRWDGASWSALGSGFEAPAFVDDLVTFDDGLGGGPALYAAGSFTVAGGIETDRIARWDGSSWSPLGSGPNGDVDVLAVHDEGSGAGPALVAGGAFTTLGGTAARRIARRDGSGWESLGSGMTGTVRALATFDDGNGAALYAGGDFTSAGGVPANRIARWEGTSWSALGSGASGTVYALAVFDEGGGGGPALFAGGSFGNAGGQPAAGIARWDGVSWSSVGGSVNFGVLAMAVFDDGSGPALFAGGTFTTAGGVPANRIARWDGVSWTALGSGMPSEVRALAVFDDASGEGPALYAGGLFATAGGVSARNIARWNGSAWSPLGAGRTSVNDLLVFDDGSGAGPALFAGTTGGFEDVGNRVSRWDGSSWTNLNTAMGGVVSTLAVFDDGSGLGPALFAGGSFSVSSTGDSFLARWQGCPDVEPPVLSCPDSVFAHDAYGGPPGEIVSFTVTATDRDPDATLVVTPPSGSFFPRGTTIVTCTATDGSGNQSTCEFPVTVQVKARRR